METFRQLVLSFPVVVFSVLLPLVALYWLLVALHLAPLELFEHDSLKGDHLANSMVSLGFAGVPVAFALSVLIVLAGGITVALEGFVLRWLSLGVFRVPLGLAVLWAAFAIASPLAAGLCQALHRWFHRHVKSQCCSLLGECVEVTAEPDTEGWTRGVLVDDPECEVRLHGKPSNMPRAGERRVLVKHIADEAAYRSVAESDFLDARTRLSRLRLKHGKYRSGSPSGRPATSPEWRGGAHQ
ncbi:hypothetical protein F0A17_13585 [Billgrantia pellis]|uniref:DUF1449 family protein n=1 Tax=Billgrantia pellis TaxID=2606936 RepID=A0A7V7G1B1_9GAMM|nr:hypothetical protein [Halomonas pellis]KAA0011154.1 hypothetical protein F0A17_13585 [Halomonas pellis]